MMILGRQDRYAEEASLGAEQQGSVATIRRGRELVPTHTEDMMMRCWRWPTSHTIKIQWLWFVAWEK